MWRRYAVLVGSLVLTACWSGCDAPDSFQHTAPPGAVITRGLPEGDKGSEANGENPTITDKSAADAREKAKLSTTTPAPPTAKGEKKKTAGGVTYETLREGTGDELKSGHVVQVHYVGHLADGDKEGKEFESSRRSGRPLEATVGAGGLIKGWEEGLPGMKVGEIRKLWIPAPLAYGTAGKGDIPANADLIFEVELLKILY
ncbi:FKBP-type peptidyl-prolyl cis-trans isomerase [Aquisphaera insulae]|uniref:FKBP-type peptidyl-prolyl cis-trans isomerase n=1 Tax=Aquisphaera insulae TaxID=2712864 RepID=UPI0013EBE470|nr:FKBP-type peptidyl-prolyl cis-trans isomerase [Aquisphaera insulae]